MSEISEVLSGLFLLFLFFCLLGIPLLLTLYHVSLLFMRRPAAWMVRWRTRLEIVTLFLGVIYSCGAAAISNICFNADWPMQLANREIHAPVATWHRPTVIVIAVIGILGYLILRLVPLRKMPPLVVVCGISFVYAGILISILWCVQISRGEYVWLALFPVNCILLALIQIKNLILQWRQLQEEERKNFRNLFLQKCSEKLYDSRKWPLFAFVLFLPILGLLIGILALFGQSPDAVIRAFTETSDWNLSTKVSPQNIYYDEHYLCTVAAGGHRKVVKPLRMGERHGHAVIVNRQLCVANAFEQVLEERLPGIHRGIRRFYDTYGLPVAKLIRSPFLADAVYFLMKPLEWIFLLTIYFTDVNPENRIAIQYLPLAEQKRLYHICKGN